MLTPTLLPIPKYLRVTFGWHSIHTSNTERTGCHLKYSERPTKAKFYEDAHQHRETGSRRSKFLSCRSQSSQRLRKERGWYPSTTLEFLNVCSQVASVKSITILSPRVTLCARGGERFALHKAHFSRPMVRVFVRLSSRLPAPQRSPRYLLNPSLRFVLIARHQPAGSPPCRTT